MIRRYLWIFVLIMAAVVFTSLVLPWWFTYGLAMVAVGCLLAWVKVHPWILRAREGRRESRRLSSPVPARVRSWTYPD